LPALSHGAVARRLRRHRALPGMLPRVARRAQRLRPRILRQVACSPPAWLVVYAAFETLVASPATACEGDCDSSAAVAAAAEGDAAVEPLLISCRFVAREMPQLSFLRLQLQRLRCISACKKGPVEVCFGHVAASCSDFNSSTAAAAAAVTAAALSACAAAAAAASSRRSSRCYSSRSYSRGGCVPADISACVRVAHGRWLRAC
jgi:hypothetical protein